MFTHIGSVLMSALPVGFGAVVVESAKPLDVLAIRKR